MSRDWLAVYTSVLGMPRYRRLSVPARAALFHIWMLAGGQSPEATWRTAADLGEHLELDGFPDDVLDELQTRGWLEFDDDKRILVHDWDDHQLAATNAVRRAYERDRKRDWRRAKEHNPLPPTPPSPDITATQQGAPQRQHNTGVPECPGPVRDKAELTPLQASVEAAWCRICDRPTSLHSPTCSDRASA